MCIVALIRVAVLMYHICNFYHIYNYCHFYHLVNPQSANHGLKIVKKCKCHQGLITGSPGVSAGNKLALGWD